MLVVVEGVGGAVGGWVGGGGRGAVCVCVCVGVESDNAPILILSPPSLGMLASKTGSASNQANLRPPTPDGIPTTDRPTDRVNEIPAHWNCR